MNKNLFALVDMRGRVYFTGTFHQTAEFAEREANGILSNLTYIIRVAEDGSRRKISLEDIRMGVLRREG